jgi:DTW domain-containing protein
MTALVTRCIRCRQRSCMCAAIEPVELRLRLVIVRHSAERTRATNSAHFAQLATGCPLLEYGGPVPLDESQVPGGDGTWLLFPGGQPADLAHPPRQLVVIDGSWSQARRMRQRISALRALPTLTLPQSNLGRDRLLRPTKAQGMSTLEAIAEAVRLFESPEAAASLHRLYDALVSSVRSTQR